MTPTPAGSAARRGGRGRGRPRRRVVLTAAGVLVLAAAVVVYLLASGVSDEPATSVGALVSAVDIAPGTEVTSADFTSTDTDLGDVPHIPWSPEAPLLFEGLVSLGHIPAGMPVVDAMFRTRQSAPFEDELEVTVELDLSATASEVTEGDEVLIVDPGAAPGETDEGRPRSIIGSLELQDFDGATTRLFVKPEEWAFWSNLPDLLGGLPQVLPVPLGGDAEEMTARLNETWLADHNAELEFSRALAEALEAEIVQVAPAPGELEVTLELDLSLSPTPPAEGDLVLLVDPGAPPTVADPGRPRQVLQPLRLRVFEGTTVRMFVPPGDWQRWSGLPSELGALPMVLPVNPDSDAEEMAGALNELWQQDYDRTLAELAVEVAAIGAEQDALAAGPGELAVDVLLDDSLSTTLLQEGDLVLLIDPGAQPTATDRGRPRRVLQPLELTNFDGLSVRLFVSPAEWLRWRSLPTELGATPMALPVPEGSDIDEMTAALNAAWSADHEAAATAAAADDAAAGTGELAVDVWLDASLSTTLLLEGDLVLLIDPGAQPTATDRGRPRRVLQPLELTNFDGLSVRLFVSPAEWLRWRSLPTELGADPMALPVPEGSDVDEMTATLNAAWSADHEAALAEVVTPPEGHFWTSLPVVLANPAAPAPREGDVVFLIDLGKPPEFDEEGNITSAGVPPNAIEWRTLEGWDGLSVNFWAEADRYAYYTFLPDSLEDRPLLALPLSPGDLTDEELDAILDDLDEALDQWAPQ